MMTCLPGRVKQVAQDAIDGSMAQLPKTATVVKAGMQRIVYYRCGYLLLGD